MSAAVGKSKGEIVSGSPHPRELRTFRPAKLDRDVPPGFETADNLRDEVGLLALGGLL
jgi:hypothetical protein